MADVKWIKLSVGLPGSRKLKQIRRLPEGDSIALLWVFLLCLAGEVNEDGLIYFTPEIPYTDEMLAEEFNMDVNIIRIGLKTFQQFGMLEIVDDIIRLDSWEKWQSVDRLADIREYNRIKKQESRARKKLLMESNVCQYCGGVASGYDHIIAKNNGGSDDDSNKIPCCKRCNSSKRDKSVVDFLNMNRDIIKLDIVCKNEKLSKFVSFNGSYFISVNDSQLTSQRCQGTDIDIEEDKEKDKELYINIIDYLNQKAGTNYKSSTKKTQTCIHARFEEGFTEDDFITVIDKKCDDWLGTEWEKFLRPETLFGTKFESYLNAKVTPKAKTNRSEAPKNSTDEFMDKLQELYEADE